MNEELVELHLYAEPDREIVPGHLVGTTTSEFSYDNIECKFKNADELEYKGKYLCRHIDRDYSQYDPNRCRNGGAYGFDYWVVIDIIEE